MTIEQKAREIADGLHHTTTLLSIGEATVMGHTVPAYETYNRIYGQTLIWGMFNVDRGKFKGNRIANNASTEGVVYTIRALIEEQKV